MWKECICRSQVPTRQGTGTSIGGIIITCATMRGLQHGTETRADCQVMQDVICILQEELKCIRIIFIVKFCCVWIDIWSHGTDWLPLP